jgi:twitching motility protein PilT
MSSEVIARFEQVLRFASTRGIAEVHIKPGQRLLYRRAGALISRKDEATFSESDLDEVADGLVPGAWLDDWAKGRDVTFPRGVVGCGRFRVTLFRQRGAVGVVVHVVPSKAQTLRELNLPKIFGNWALLPRGLVLIGGAPGSGRSVTWQALIEHINTVAPQPRHVLTLEDPIEVLFDDKMAFIRQRELRTDTGDLRDALSHVARMDCDVVAINDLAAADIGLALSLAEQGRLVLAVVAGGTPVQWVRQILDQQEPARREPLRHRLAAQVQGLSYQTLVPTADGKGRVPAVETLSMTAQMADVLRGAGDVGALQPLIDQGRAYGSQTLEQHLVDLAHAGTIAVDQALQASDQPDALRNRIAGVAVGMPLQAIGKVDELPF